MSMLTVLVRKEREYNTSLFLSISFAMNLKLMLGWEGGATVLKERNGLRRVCLSFCSSSDTTLILLFISDTMGIEPKPTSSKNNSSLYTGIESQQHNILRRWGVLCLFWSHQASDCYPRLNQIQRNNVQGRMHRKYSRVFLKCVKWCWAIQEENIF